MVECNYCGESFEDEDAHLAHLAGEHAAELGPIDRRRVDQLDQSDDGGLTIWHLGTVVLAIGILAGAAWIALFSGNGSVAAEPSYNPSVHYHGTMAVEIDGEPLDLSGDDRFVMNDQLFHFHGNEQQRYGEHVWHVHGDDVTLAYALGTLGIEVDETGEPISFDGETYKDSDSETTVEITVNGESVDPETHVLDGVGPVNDAAAGGGDDVRVVIETG